jgi:hypothetical protein
MGPFPQLKELWMTCGDRSGVFDNTRGTTADSVSLSMASVGQNIKRFLIKNCYFHDLKEKSVAKKISKKVVGALFCKI